MFSVICLIIFLVVIFVFMGFSKALWIRYIALFVLTALVIETITLGCFFVQIQRGRCFFLIGQDKFLDNLIKLRLSYAIYFAQGKKDFINKVDDDLGYSLGKNKISGKYRTNGQGFRANKDYSLFPDDNHLRMVALGDSFVFCDGERNEDAWPFILEGLNDRLEVLNFGVPGYGLGQSYLRYLKYAREYHPDVVFINYVTLGPRDKIDRQGIIGLNNLRTAEYYRVNFWVEEGVLKTKAVSLYDLFDTEFRKKFLYDEEQVLNGANLGFLKRLSFLNTGILAKEVVFQHLLVKKLPAYPSDDDNAINYKILSDLLKTAQKDGSRVIFFCREEFGQLPKDIQGLLQTNKMLVTYVESDKAIQEQIKLHNAQRHNIRNSSYHYNSEGNHYYAEAVLKILKLFSWCRGEKCFNFEK